MDFVFVVETLKRALPKMFNISWVFVSFLIAFNFTFEMSISMKCWNIGEPPFKERTSFFLYENITYFICFDLYISLKNIWVLKHQFNVWMSSYYITLDNKISNQVAFILKKNYRRSKCGFKLKSCWCVDQSWRVWPLSDWVVNENH